MCKLSSLLLVLILPGLVSADVCRSHNSTIPNIKLELVIGGLDAPVSIAHANDERLFVLEQEGRIRIIQDNQTLPQAFLNIEKKVVDGFELGLLSIAFHPDFAKNGLFYINYTTDDGDVKTRISEFKAKGNSALPDSERILMEYKQPWNNHNGGQLAFGPDGYLYIAVGDGGSANDPNNNGQNLTTLLGSILRIDVNKRDPGLAYAIPKDNPFVNRKGARGEIWAYGLRNPWRFSFDRLTGELYAADVGQDAVEEINIIEKGKNYGWRIMEGPICTPGVNPDCNKQGLELPVYSYDHSIGRSITGGYVYRGKAIPELCGSYLYGDFVNQALWAIRIENGKVVAHMTLFQPRSALRLAIDYFDDDSLLISTFGEDVDGEIYLASYQSGRIYKIVAP